MKNIFLFCAFILSIISGSANAEGFPAENVTKPQGYFLPTELIPARYVLYRAGFAGYQVRSENNPSPSRDIYSQLFFSLTAGLHPNMDVKFILPVSILDEEKNQFPQERKTRGIRNVESGIRYRLGNTQQFATAFGLDLRLLSTGAQHNGTLLIPNVAASYHFNSLPLYIYGKYATNFDVTETAASSHQFEVGIRSELPGLMGLELSSMIEFLPNQTVTYTNNGANLHFDYDATKRYIYKFSLSLPLNNELYITPSAGLIIAADRTVTISNTGQNDTALGGNTYTAGSNETMVQTFKLGGIYGIEVRFLY